MTGDRQPTRPAWLSDQLYPFESHFAQLEREQLFPDHRTVLLDGAGHYIQEDAPEEIIGAIRSFGAA